MSNKALQYKNLRCTNLVQHAGDTVYLQDLLIHSPVVTIIPDSMAILSSRVTIFLTLKSRPLQMSAPAVFVLASGWFRGIWITLLQELGLINTV